MINKVNSIATEHTGWHPAETKQEDGCSIVAYFIIDRSISVGSIWPLFLIVSESSDRGTFSIFTNSIQVLQQARQSRVTLKQQVHKAIQWTVRRLRIKARPPPSTLAEL